MEERFTREDMMIKLKALSCLAFKVSIVALMLVAVTAIVPASSNAGTFPKVVYGYVKDSVGTPLDGADITVNVRRPDTSIRATMTDTTGSIGDYMVSFDPADWLIGDTVQVISDFSGHQTDETTDPLTEEGPMWVNITYEYEIPEFGSTAGLLVTGALLGAVGIVTIVYFRKR